MCKLKQKQNFKNLIKNCGKKNGKPTCSKNFLENS